MKTRHPLAVKLTSLLSITFLIVGETAGAQTSYYYSSGSGAPVPGGAISGGTLASIGFDSYQTSTYDPVTHSDPGGMSIGADGFDGYFYQNYMAAGIPTTLGDGSTLSSVTFIMFVDTVSPGNQTTSFQIYDGLGGAGSPTTTISLTHPEHELNYFTFTVPKSVFDDGFSIGAFDVSAVTFSTELNSIASRTPMVIANYDAVPEPSAALLGSIATLGLFLRRRNS